MNANRVTRLTIAAPMSLLLMAGAAGAQEIEQPYGPNPTLPEPQRGLLPNMGVPEKAPWNEQMPTVPDGYSIEAIATDLQVPRQMLVLPNGDILVAEGKGGGNAPKSRPKDVIAGLIKSKGTTSVSGGNRLTLLRDTGDGSYERSVFAEDLNAPYGLALIGNDLYVANQDSLVRFDYEPGQTEASGPPERITDLPSAINHHWTKSMTASADGDYLYVGIGSNSNITERGMEAEVDRAEIWQIDPETGAHRTYASGIRNPTSLTIQPGSDQLWAVVNERDELGPHLVPDYLTSVQEGAFYGWPYSYWGQNVDPRVKPENPSLVESAIAPDYSLGSHHAPLGVAFANDAVGGDYREGVFVGEHGSWNRSDLAGYRVSFVPFENGEPAGDPIDFVSGFLTDDGRTRGRPVGVSVTPEGAVLVADDFTNAIWRVTRDDAPDQATDAMDDSAADTATEPSPSSDDATSAPDEENDTAG
ncbi:PQQ-dependent sugar dehydrogenase [Salinicola avicenniae]|uniref:PQQ-dependent sugar dehydrogenase n=1 Tax=Salinicola avicenniae TaxID=2916836 RepID=UPI002073F2CA|nr:MULTISPECIES: sorbosone dehydrogenase family protein [unclassified Salinicola]